LQISRIPARDPRLNRDQAPAMIDDLRTIFIFLSMNILDRLLGHDAWTTWQLLLRCRELNDDQLDRDFDIGHRSGRATLLHIIRNMEVWTDLIAEKPVRASEDRDAAGRSIDGLLRRLDCVAAELAAASTRVARDGRLDDYFLDPLDNPSYKKSFGGAIVHVITHSMHHRAQLLGFFKPY
jgi:uncharacterized damage-inducible protein DinB